MSQVRGFQTGPILRCDQQTICISLLDGVLSFGRYDFCYDVMRPGVLKLIPLFHYGTIEDGIETRGDHHPALQRVMGVVGTCCGYNRHRRWL
jgi:hypothetical protein